MAESSVRGESGCGGQGTLCVQVKDAFKFKLSYAVSIWQCAESLSSVCTMARQVIQSLFFLLSLCVSKHSCTLSDLGLFLISSCWCKPTGRNGKLRVFVNVRFGIPLYSPEADPQQAYVSRPTMPSYPSTGQTIRRNPVVLARNSGV